MGGVEGVLGLDAIPGKLDLEDTVGTAVGHHEPEQLLLPSKKQVLLISPKKDEHRCEVFLIDEGSSQLQKDRPLLTARKQLRIDLQLNVLLWTKVPDKEVRTAPSPTHRVEWVEDAQKLVHRILVLVLD